MKKISLWKGLSVMAMSFVLSVAAFSVVASAEEKTVTITPDNYNGGVAVQEAFDLQMGDKPQYDMLTVVLSPGTYNMDECFVVYGNTTIEATGATINYTRSKSGNIEGNQIGRNPIIANYSDGKKGYEGAGNITIHGGTWDFQGKSGQVNNPKSGKKATMEAIRFMHGSKYTLSDMTFQNLYLSHYLTIEGVTDVTVKNCTFKDSQNPKAKKESIHIDIMHDDGMAPANNQDTVYDDTYCNNVTITGCTFSNVARGFGTHIAVAGLYPTNMVFTDNTFTNITYEAIKAYHYKNVTIENNTITNAGTGIKAYLYANPDEDKDGDDADNEGGGNYRDALKGTQTEGVPSNLNVSIKNNTIQGITNSTVGFGIHLVGSSDRIVNGAVIEGNKIISNGSKTTELSAIYVNYANSVSVLNNTVEKSDDCGMLISESSNLTVTGNQVTNAEKNGILAQRCRTITMSGNTVTSPGAHGIYMSDTSGATLTENKISKDKSGSICADKTCPNVQITKNQAISSGKNAIAVFSSANALVEGNTIQSPKNFGVYMTKSNSSQIKSNAIQSAKKFGVYVSDSKSVQLVSNTIQSSKKFGIYLTKSNSSQIKSNVVKDSGDTGIIADSSTSVKVTKNTVNKTGKYGILITKGKKTYATNNTVSAAKNYPVIYANNCKNKRLNLRFLEIVAQKGKKVVTGRTTPKLKVSVSVNDGKAKSKKAPKNGKFSIKTKKLKAGDKVLITLKDSWGNVATKTYKAK